MNHAMQFLKNQIGLPAVEAPSNIMKWLVPVLLSAEEGKVEFEYEIRKDMTNPAGTLHGGIIAAIIDDVIGCAAFSYGEQTFFGTVSLSVDYLAPAYASEKVKATACIIRKGSRLLHATCEVCRSGSGRLVARGTSVLIPVETGKLATA